jgi:hypothetical protein
MHDRKGDRCDCRPSLEISIIRVCHHESKKVACFWKEGEFKEQGEFEMEPTR